MEDEIIEPAVAEEEATAGVQQYEGTDESAMETAKRRMAERDAEYSAKFAQLTEEKKPAKKTAAAYPKKEAAKNGYAQDIAREGRGVEKREYTPPAAKEEKGEPVSAKSDEPKKGDMSFDEVAGGLRSLKGGTKVPSQKKEYSDAFKKFSK